MELNQLYEIMQKPKDPRTVLWWWAKGSKFYKTEKPNTYFIGLLFGEIIETPAEFRQLAFDFRKRLQNIYRDVVLDKKSVGTYYDPDTETIGGKEIGLKLLKDDLELIYKGYLAENGSAAFYRSRKWLELRHDVLKESDGSCALCGARKENGVRMVVDHIKPRSKYPHLELEKSNLRLVCNACNMGKGVRDTD